MKVALHIFNNDLNKKVRFNGKLEDQKKFEENIIKVTKFPKLTISEHFKYIKNIELRDRDTCNVISSLRINKTIKFSFKNVKYSGNFQYLEFDIKAKVNIPGLKFGKGNLYVKYSRQFGKNIIANNAIEVSKGTIIQHSLYNLTSVDIDSQRFKISILPQYTSNNMFTFSESEEDLAHVKIKISDFTNIGSISFADIDISGEVFYWCQGEYGLFDETNLSEPITATSNSNGNAIGITYTFENSSYNSSTNKFSVDLYAKATSSSKYADAFIYINYNDIGFGSKVVSNGTFQFQQEDLLANTSIYEVYKSDIDENSLRLVVVSGNDESGFETLSTSPRKLGKLIFTVNDCNADKNINFDQLTETSSHVHYTGNMPIPYEWYDPVIADDEEIGKICNCQKPIVSSFSPATIHGGLGEILTITGQNFGAFVPLKSTIIFNNADDVGSSESEAGVKDFYWDDMYHWTDTEIKIKVPGCNRDKGTAQPPATGKIKVKSLCDLSDVSNNNLNIPYTVFNYRGAPEANPKRLNLQSNSPNNSICFKFSDAIPEWVEIEFANALKDWCNATGINFLIGGTITKNTPEGIVDGINLISFSSGSGGLFNSGQSYFVLNKCSNDEYFFSELDMVIKSTYVNTVPSDESGEKKRVREAIKHELGHMQMIQHAKGFSQLMGPNGNVDGIITSNDQEGANLVFSSSLLCGSNPIGNGICGNSCATNFSKEEIYDEIKISPNPVSNVLSIFSYVNTNMKIQILNANGIVVSSLILSDNDFIDVSELPSGIYTCKITSFKKIVYKKFVKI